MSPILLHYLNLWEPFGYILLFLGMMVEGDTFLFIAAFLAHQGVLGIIPTITVALWGMIFGDNLWYSAGLKLRNSKSVLNRWSEKLAKPLDEHIITKPFRTIFIAKFIYGINRAVIFRAGTLKIKWSKLEQSDILATLCWMAVIGGLGYFSGASFSVIKHYFRYGQTALLAIIIAFFAIEYLIKKGIRKNL